MRMLVLLTIGVWAVAGTGCTEEPTRPKEKGKTIEVDAPGVKVKVESRKGE